MRTVAVVDIKALLDAINAEHKAAFGDARSAMEHAAECGRLLLDAKELFAHGEWLPWLEANTEISPRQCQRYMRLAENWAEIEAKNDGASYLGGIDGALKLLAKPKAKPAFKDPNKPLNGMTALEWIEAGMPPAPQEPEPEPALEPEPGEVAELIDAEKNLDEMTEIVVRESDPIQLAMQIVTAMDNGQLREFLKAVDEHKATRRRK